MLKAGFMSGEMEKPLSDRQGSKATMLPKPRHMETSRWVEIQQKGMDDVTDHGGMVNGFQWQNENAKPACFFVLG